MAVLARAGFAVEVLLLTAEFDVALFDAAVREAEAEVRLEVAVAAVELDRLEAEALVDAAERLDDVEEAVTTVLLCVLVEAVREVVDDALDAAAAGLEEAGGTTVLLVAVLRLFVTVFEAADDVPPMLPTAVAVATLPGMSANDP